MDLREYWNTPYSSYAAIGTGRGRAKFLIIHFLNGDPYWILLVDNFLESNMASLTIHNLGRLFSQFKTAMASLEISGRFIIINIDEIPSNIVILDYHMLFL